MNHARLMLRSWLRTVLCVGVCLLVHSPFLQVVASAQILKAQWVDESEARIDKIRKADLRIILIDKDGNPVARCPVRIEQVQHAFRWGVRLPRELPEDLPARSKWDATPLWRVFNTVSLESHTKWPMTQPKAGEWDFENVEKLLAFARERNLSVRWGGILSTDPGRMPDWAAGLRGDELRVAVEAHAKEVMRRFGRRVDQFDVVTQMIDHRHLENELGFAAIRRLFLLTDYERSNGVPAGGARSVLAFDDAFAPARLQKGLRMVTAFREGFVPLDAIAIEVKFAGSLVEAPITRNLEWLGDPGLPVTVTNLEVAGEGRADASVNLETALRAMFSQPCVEGIQFAGLRGRELQHEEAALVDDDGSLTSSGELVDKLVRQHWWSEATVPTDDLGNIRHRVFAGSHRITATLPDGSVADVHVRLTPGQSRLVLLQPVKAAPSPAVARAPASTDAPQEEPLVIKPVKDPTEHLDRSKSHAGSTSNAGESSEPPVKGRSRLEFAPQP